MRILTAVLALATVNQLNLSRQAAQPVTNSAVFATHSQLQQTTDIRCVSQNGTSAYTCGPCPPTGICRSGIGPNPMVQQLTYGMEFQFVPDVPCMQVCSINIDNLGILTIYKNDGGATVASFGSGFHRIAIDQINNQFIARLEY